MSEEQQPQELLLLNVYYEAKQRSANYGHEVLGAMAHVAAYEDPDRALAAVKEWVHDRLGLSERAAQLIQSCEALRDEEKRLQEAVSMMRNRYEKARVFLEKIGLPAPASWHDESDLPF